MTHTDTFKRIKANGFAVLILEWCGTWALVRYCGMNGKAITRESFWICDSDMRSF